MRAIFLVPLALLAAVSARAAGLTVGDKAPALKVAKWVKGEPIAAFEPGKVYVVEFWATWCGPCKVSIPHLSELAKKYKDKVAFTGVAVWEREKTDYATKVPQFVEQMGDKMAYRVASDDPEETPMAKTWMQAAGQNGIPSAFIVDQKGEIAWIGHPMLGLDETLEKVVAGTWDKAKFAADFKEEQESKAKYDAYRVELKAAFNEKDPSKAIALIDRTIPQIPLYADDLAVTKWTLLLGSDEKKSYAYAEEISGTVIKDNPNALNQIAWTIVDSPRLKEPDYKLAMKLAKQASAILKDNDAMVLDTLAVSQFKLKDKAGAIATEKKAIALAVANKLPDNVIEELKGRLAEFEKP